MVNIGNEMKLTHFACTVISKNILKNYRENMLAKMFFYKSDKKIICIKDVFNDIIIILNSFF